MVFVTADHKESANSPSNNVLSPKANSPVSPLNSTPRLHRSTSSLLNISNSAVVAHDNSQPVSLSLSFLNKKRHSDTAAQQENESPTSTASLITHSPKLLRKKSGELVKSSLKLNILADGVSKSMPTTPTFKNVHFGQNVDVRYFSDKEKPSAVSASSSPTLKSTKLRRWSKSKIGSGATFEFNQFGDLPASGDFYNGYNNIDDIYDDDGDDDMSEVDCEDADDGYEILWDLQTVNFTKIKYNEKFHQRSKIFLERLTLDDENQDDEEASLLGLVAVKNLSFEKKIHIRYTFDNWRTVIEIEAKFDNDGSTRILKRANYDRFKFQIPLSNFKFLNQDNIKIMFCIRYRYNGLEVWDNNDYRNYELLLTKTRRAKFAQRKFMLNDYFNQDHHSNSFESNHMGASNPISPKSQVPEMPTFDITKTSNDAYFNNYDGIKSPETPRVLKNCINANNDDVEDDPLMTPIFRDLNNFTDLSTPPSSALATNDANEVNSLARSANKLSLLSDEENFVKAATTEPKPQDLTAHDTNFVPSHRKKPSINSRSYQELIDSYCFFKSSDENTPSTVSSYLNDK